MLSRIVGLIVMVLLAPCWSSWASAQNCKPDVSSQDRISKEQRDVWVQKLFATSFMGSLNSSSEVIVTGTVGRYGSLNALNVQIQKEEESLQNAAFESKLRAVEGNQFFFGLKDGKPLSFVANSVSNGTKAPTSFMAGFSGKKLVTTVVLSVVLSDRELGPLREALTNGHIDSVRILLAGDIRVEKSVSAGDGEKMRQKFSCFYQTLDKRGIDLTATATSVNEAAEVTDTMSGTDYSTSAPGKYLYKTGGSGHKPGDYMELGADGKWYGEAGGRGFAGTYVVSGNIVTAVLPNGQAFRGKFVGNTIVWSDGTVNEKQPAPARPATSQLTVDHIIQMVAAKIPDDVIIASIQKAGSMFDVSPEVLIKLKSAGASDAVIRVIAK